MSRNTLAKTICALLVLLASGPARASDLYSEEINAVRERERLYLTEARFNHARLLEFNNEWAMIGVLLSQFDLGIHVPSRKKIPDYFKKSEYLTALYQAVAYKTSLEMAKERITHLKNERLRDHLKRAEAALKDTAFGEGSSLWAMHHDRAWGINSQLHTLQKSVDDALVKARHTIQKLEEFQHARVLHEIHASKKRLLSDLAYADIAAYFNGIFSSVLRQFDHAIVQRRLDLAEEALAGFEWLRLAAATYMRRTTVDTPYKQDILQTLEDWSLAEYTKLVAEVSALRIKMSKAQKNAAPAAQRSEIPQEEASQNGRRRGGPYAEAFFENVSLEDFQDPVKGEEKPNQSMNELIPENRPGSNSCSAQAFDFNGESYRASTAEDKLYVEAEKEQAQSIHSFELGGYHPDTGAPIVKDQQEFPRGERFRMTIRAHWSNDSWNPPSLPSGQNQALSDYIRDYKPNALRPQDDSRTPTPALDLRQSIHKVGELVDGARERSRNNEVRAELAELKGDIARLERTQRANDRELSQKSETIARTVRDAHVSWHVKTEGFSFQPPNIPQLPGFGQNFDPEKINAEIRSTLAAINDVTLGFTAGVAYDAANFLHAMAFNQDIWEQPVDAVDKMLMGAAVVLGIVEPVGAKSGALRAMRGMFSQSSKLVRELTQHMPAPTREFLQRRAKGFAHGSKNVPGRALTREEIQRLGELHAKLGKRMGNIKGKRLGAVTVHRAQAKSEHVKTVGDLFRQSEEWRNANRYENHRFSQPGDNAFYGSIGAKGQDTALAELDATGGEIISGTKTVELKNTLDLTDPKVLDELGITPDQIKASSDYEITQVIGDIARQNGFDSIVFKSSKLDGGINAAILNW